MHHDLLQLVPRGDDVSMTGARIALPFALAVAAAIASLAIVPLALEADQLLAIAEDPVAIADRAVTKTFDATVAEREITAALAANDADLAGSFLELAREQNVPVDPAVAKKVDAAVADANSATRNLESFARGLITGEPEDLIGLAGTAVGDLFVFGDVRDVVREGTRLAAGQPADELILGLACVGIAVTAGTYASLGAGAPARVGLTVVKAARKTGRMGTHMATWLSRTLRDAVDWSKFKRVLGPGTLTQPANVARAAREAVKAEKVEGLVKVVGDVGRVQAKAGTQAALDSMKIAQGPRDMARMSRLAAAKGGKTRAILKLAGRGAILLTMGTFNLAMWMFWAAFTAFGFVSALKRMVERSTERACARRKLRRARQAERCERERREQAEQELRLAALAASAEEPTVIYSSAPSLAPQAEVAEAPVVEAPQPADPVVIQRPAWPGLSVPSRAKSLRGPQPEPLENSVLAFRGAARARTA
jgi:hypothetical protein